jgi:hypothetical protein
MFEPLNSGSNGLGFANVRLGAISGLDGLNRLLNKFYIFTFILIFIFVYSIWATFLNL